MGLTRPLSLSHRLWRVLPVRARRAMAMRLAAMLAGHVSPPPPTVACTCLAVAGEIGRASGLGQGARVMLQALSKLGVATTSLDVTSIVPGGVIDLAATESEPPPAGAPLVVHVNPPLLPLTMWRMLRHYTANRRVVGYWSWELATVPPDWRYGAHLVHEVWVPSHFTASAIEPLLPGRIRVVPHPVAAVPPVPSSLDRAAFGLPGDAVIVLASFNLASSFERKNPLAAVAAFRSAFADRQDRILVLKVGNPHHFADDFERLRTAVAEAPNIKLETRTFPTGDNDALTACADIVLSLHRSEGFGMVLAEAMLLGKPVIATGWSGNLDFMDATSAILVHPRLTPVRDPRRVYRAVGGESPVWADPDPDEAAMHLRRLADRAELRRELGAQAAKAAGERLGLEPLASALQSIGVQVAVPAR